MKSHTVTFRPSGKRGPASPGQDVLSVARSAGVEIESTCGGKGACGKCRVRIEPAAGGKAQAAGGSTAGTAQAAPLSEPTAAESRHLGEHAVSSGLRLACQARVAGDLRVFVPKGSRRTAQTVRKEARARPTALDPAIRSYRVAFRPPALKDPEADAERLLAALEQQHGLTGLSFDPEVLETLPALARQAKGDLVTIVWSGQIIIAVRPATDQGRVLGLALDIGTTTIAAYLCDLASGEVLATESALNPQVAYGGDVIARLDHAAHDPGGLAELQGLAVGEVNNLARKAAERSGAALDDIFDVVMVGNTVMHHLFLGFDTRSLRSAPFTPALQGATNTKASALGLTFHRGCRLHALPVEAAFVGADNVAVLLAEEPYNQEEVLLIADIGTNGELVLGNRQRLLSASCATGPAFEGAHIEFGMRAAPGAIERVRIDPGTLRVRFKVIGLEGWQTDHPAGEVRALGICGSGIIEAVAELLKAGVILPSGGLNPELSHERVLMREGRPRRFVLARSEETVDGDAITVSLKDIRALQLAKAALRAGAEILLRTYGVAKPDRVILAGAFGSYIDKHHALAIGMLPECDPETISSVGNAAGDGALLALTNLDKRREAAWIAAKVEYVELATAPDFQKEYIQAMWFDPVSDIPED